MIQITMSFSSIAEAVKALAGLPMGSLLPGGVSQVVQKPDAAGNAQAQADTPAPKPAKAASTARTAAAPAADAQETKASSSDEQPADDLALDYTVLQQAVFKLAAKSKEAAVALNASFGVKTMKDLDPAKRREALAAVNEKLTELEVA